jgi:hydrogenase maturation protease
MKARIIGVGNLLLADDGVGIRVVRELKRRIDDPRVLCIESERGGLDLLEGLEGADRAIVVDAAATGAHPAGSISRFILRKPFIPGSCPSLHALSIDALLALGSSAGVPLPDDVILYAIEAADIESFGADCTGDVESAIPEVVAMVQGDIQSFFTSRFIASDMQQEQYVQN